MKKQRSGCVAPLATFFWPDLKWPRCALEIVSRERSSYHSHRHQLKCVTTFEKKRAKTLEGNLAVTRRRCCCAFFSVCYKTKRCLKALLGISGALGRAMLLEPLLAAKYTKNHGAVNTRIFSLPTHKRGASGYSLAFLHFLTRANLQTPCAQTPTHTPDTITTVLSQHIICVPLQRSSHLSSLSSDGPLIWQRGGKFGTQLMGDSFGLSLPRVTLTFVLNAEAALL